MMAAVTPVAPAQGRKLQHTTSLGVLPMSPTSPPMTLQAPAAVDPRRTSNESPPPSLTKRASTSGLWGLGGGRSSTPAPASASASASASSTANAVTPPVLSKRTSLLSSQKQRSMSNIPAEVSAQLGEAAPRPARPKLRLENIPERMPGDRVLPLGPAPTLPVSSPVTHHPLRAPNSARGVSATVAVATGSAAAAMLQAQEQAAEAFAIKVREEDAGWGVGGGGWGLGWGRGRGPAMSKGDDASPQSQRRLFSAPIRTRFPSLTHPHAHLTLGTFRP